MMMNRRTFSATMVAGAVASLVSTRGLAATALPRLTRLLSLGKSRAGKARCDLTWDDVAAWGNGMIFVPVEPWQPPVKALPRLSAAAG